MAAVLIAAGGGETSRSVIGMADRSGYMAQHLTTTTSVCPFRQSLPDPFQIEYSSTNGTDRPHTSLEILIDVLHGRGHTGRSRLCVDAIAATVLAWSNSDAATCNPTIQPCRCSIEQSHIFPPNRDHWLFLSTVGANRICVFHVYCLSRLWEVGCA
jgi:hypothetical protein